jgi:Polysaccharide biosynthesis protein
MSTRHPSWLSRPFGLPRRGSAFSSVGMLVIAGIIGPRRLGLTAIALGIMEATNFFPTTLFHDAIVQRPWVTTRHLGSAFWSVLVLSVVFSAATVALAAPTVLSRLEPSQHGWWHRISFPRMLRGGGSIPMDCVGCGSAAVTERPELTAQGYRRFRCQACGKQFNERSDGVLNRASLPSDIIAFVVFCRLRYRLTLRDLSEIMLLRGFTVSHECIRQWEAKLVPVMGEALRKRRHATGRSSGQSWYVDESVPRTH